MIFTKEILKVYDRKMLTEIIFPISGSSSSIIRQPVDVVIVDMFLADPVAVCHDRAIPFYYFDAANAMFFQHSLLLNEDTPVVPQSEADVFILLPKPSHPLQSFTLNAKKLFLPVKRNAHLAAGVIINTVRDLESNALEIIANDPSMSGLTVTCVGPLLSSGNSTANLVTEKRIGNWLGMISLICNVCFDIRNGKWYFTP